MKTQSFIMKGKTALNFITIMFLVFLSASCDSSTGPDGGNQGRLQVKFQNSPGSEYTINTLLVQPMGQASDSTTPQGEWSTNVLPAGTTLAPGEFTLFYLDIPNLHWDRYRVGVLGATGATVMLHEQTGWNYNEPSITHWGSDDRTVSITIVYDDDSGMIVINGWSDWAGIED